MHCPATEVMCGIQPGFLRERKCEIAIWVTRMGCVMLMSMSAYLESAGLSLEGGFPGGSQKFDHGYAEAYVSWVREGGGKDNWLVDSCSRAHDICSSEMCDCYLEHLV